MIIEVARRQYVDTEAADADIEEVDVHCAHCGADDDLTVYHYPDLPILAVCADCDAKES